jgi:hypothetical protein
MIHHQLHQKTNFHLNSAHLLMLACKKMPIRDLQLMMSIFILISFFFCSLRNTSVRTYGLIYILKIIMQLLHHPFIKKYEKVNVELSAYIRTIVDPKQRLKEIADVSLSSHFSIFLHSNLSQVIRTFPLSIPCG